MHFLPHLVVTGFLKGALPTNGDARNTGHNRMSQTIGTSMKRGIAVMGGALALLLCGLPAHADRITNPVAEFTGIDKITGRIINFDVYIDETVQFGALLVTPRVCYSRPATEEPKTDSFVEVDEMTLDRKVRRIFTGWMFAESPGLNAVEHAVYDVWLKGCKPDSDVPPPEKQS